MIKRALDISRIGIILILLAALIPVLLILILIFGNESNVSKKEVMGYLRRMYSGEVDQYWWDDFLNVPIKHPELDAIRDRCDKIWHPDSGFLVKNEQTGDFELTERGLSEIAELIVECSNIETTNSSRTSGTD